MIYSIGLMQASCLGIFTCPRTRVWTNSHSYLRSQIKYFLYYFPLVPMTTRAFTVAAGNRTHKRRSSSPLNASVSPRQQADVGTVADAHLDDQYPRGSASFTQAQNGQLRLGARSVRLSFSGSLGGALSPPCSLAPSHRKGSMAAPSGHHAGASPSSDDSSGLRLSLPPIFLHNNTLYAQK